MLIASVVVPLLKMMILTLLLLSVRRRSTWRIREQTRLYALVEVIGRWSMLDIFVVALLASLVRGRVPGHHYTRKRCFGLCLGCRINHARVNEF